MKNKNLDHMLIIRDADLANKFRDHRHQQTTVPFILYWCAEMLFCGYRLMLVDNKAGDWDLTTKNNPATPAPTQRRDMTYMHMGGWLVILIMFLLARYKWKSIYQALNLAFVVNLCLFNYFYMPFNPEKPREFVYWTIILNFRVTITNTIFQLNGMWDLVVSAVLMIITICARIPSITDTENLPWLICPIAIAILGTTVCNFMIAIEQRNLFLLEKNTAKQQQEQMSIINLLPGGTFVLSPDLKEIMFKNAQVADMDWISKSGNNIDDSYRFKIVPQIQITDTKKDAVRLYENEIDEDAAGLQDNEENQRIVDFAGAIKEAQSNNNTVTLFRLDNEQWLSIRIQTIHFKGREAILIFT